MNNAPADNSRRPHVSLPDMTGGTMDDLQQFKAAFEHMNVGMAIVALDGHFKSVNRALCDLLGYTAEELQAKRFADLTHPDDLAASQAHLRRMLAGEIASFRTEKRYLHKHGETIWIELASTLVRDAQQQPRYFISQLMDIQLRKKAEDRARRREVELAEALRIAQLAHWEYDVLTDTFTFNDQFYALFRTTAEREGGYQMSSQHYAQRFVHPEDAPLVGQEIQKALTTTDPNYSGHIDHRIIYADGETGYITVRFTIEKDAQGRTIRTHGANQDITAQRRSQEQLHLLTSAVEAAATGIAITDREGKIEWINPAFTRLTGYTREEATGQNPRVLKSGKMPPEFYRNLWQTISAGQVWRGELINRRKDGTEYSEEMTITPVRAHNGEIMHFVAVKQDVTQRKQAEEALIEEGNLIRTLIDALPDRIYAKDLESRFTLANATEVRLDGAKSFEDLRGKSDFDFYPRELAEQYIAAEQPILRDGQSLLDYEEQSVDQAGNITWHLSSKVPLRNSRGEIVGLVGTTRDVSEAKQAEANLALERNRLRTLIDSLPDSIFIKDRDSRFLVNNLAHLRVLGAKTQEEVFGKNDFDFFPRELAEQYFADEQALMQAGQPLYNKEESVLDQATGQIRSASSTKVPLKNTHGEVIGFVGFSQDITERKQIEEALKAQAVFWQHLIDTIPSPIFFKDIHGVYQGCNVAFEKYLGRSRDRIIGLSVFDMSPKDLAEKYHAMDKVLFDKPGTQVYESQVQYADGTRHNVIFNKATTLSLDGNVTGLVGIIQDITDLKRAEETLRRSQAQLAEALRIAQLANWEYDVLSDTFTFNDQFYALLRTRAEREGGYQLSSMQYAQRFVHPEDAPIVGAEIQQAIASTDPHFSRQIDHRIIYADGTPGYISVRYQIEKDADGRTVRIHGANQDITERKRAEENLRRATEGLHAIFWHATVTKLDDPNTGTGGYGWTTEFSNLDAVSDFLPLPEMPDTAIINRFYSCWLAEDRPEMDRRSTEALREGRDGYSQEFRLRDANGNIHWMYDDARIQRVNEKQFEIIGFMTDITERKRAEEVLAQERTTLRTLIDNLPDYMYIKDATSHFILANNTAALNISGQTPDALIGKSDFDFFPSEIATLYYNDEQELIRTGRSLINHEEPTINAQGERRWLSTTKVPLFDAQGKVTRLLGIGRDITESKLAEEALRRSEAELAEALKIAKLAYWEYDVEKDLFLFNDQFFAIFHTTAEQHGGYQLSSAYYAQHFVYPEDLPVVGAEIERALHSTDRHYSRSLEHRIQFANGGIGYISVSINIDRDEQGKILRYYGANQDITVRKQAEEALRRSQVQLAEALRIAQLANWEYDVLTDTFTFNDQFYALFHTTAEREGGYQMSSMQYAQRFVHPEDAPLVGQTIQQALETSDPTYHGQVDHRVLYADGEIGYITARFAIAEMADGRPIKTYGANQDITARKLAEAEREQLLAQQQRRTLQLQTAAEVSRAAASILDSDELITSVVELMRERFGLYYVGIFMTDETGHWAELRAGTGEAGRQMLARKHRLQIGGQSMIGWCIANGRARIALDVGDEAVRFENPLLPLTRSEMALPLIGRGVTIGAATVQSTEPNAFSDEDITVLQTMADQLTIAVSNAQLFEQTRQTIGELDALNRRLIGEAWEAYTQQKGGEQTFIWHSNDEQITPLTQADLTQLDADQTLTQSISDEEYVSIPVALRGQIIGALRFHVPARQWTENAQNLATSIAGHLAQAVENARLIEQTQLTAAREKQVATAADRIHRATDLDRVLRTALEEIGRITGAQEIGIQLGTASAAPANGNGRHASDEQLTDMGGSHA